MTNVVDLAMYRQKAQPKVPSVTEIAGDAVRAMLESLGYNLDLNDPDMIEGARFITWMVKGLVDQQLENNTLARELYVASVVELNESVAEVTA